MRRTKTSQPLKSKIEVPWDTTGALNSNSQVSIPLDQITLPPTQPRRYFDSEALRHLTESIIQQFSSIYTITLDLTPQPPSLRGKGEYISSPLLVGEGLGERL
jgi:hypothetical protein